MKGTFRLDVLAGRVAVIVMVCGYVPGVALFAFGKICVKLGVLLPAVSPTLVIPPAEVNVGWFSTTEALSLRTLTKRPLPGVQALLVQNVTPRMHGRESTVAVTFGVVEARVLMLNNTG